MPYGRAGALLAYDAADGYVVLFGGQILTPYAQYYYLSNETWTYVGGNWTNLTSSLVTAPPAEQGGVLVYDAADRYLLLETAGAVSINGSYVLTPESWTFAGGIWTYIHPASSPGILGGESAAFDSTDGYVVLFGGSSSSRSTWTFSKGNWSELNTTPAPWARQGAIMVDDPAAGYVLLSGGEAWISGNQVATNDTWTYQKGNWTQVTPSPASSPTQVGGLVGASYDPISKSILAFVDCYYGSGVFEYSNGNWTTVDACASLQILVAITYDAADGELLALTGWVGSDFTNPTWVSLYSYWNGTLALVSGPPDIPSAWNTGALADDSGDGYLVYYSQTGTMIFAGASWVNSGSVREPGANQCYQGVMTYDSHDGYVLLFCGQTWEYRGGNWTEAVQAVTDTWPSFAAGASIAYDSKDAEVVLFGGADDSTWTWTSGNWTNVTGSGGSSPTARIDASMCDDPADGYVLFFGGLTGASSVALNDTWSFSGGNWTQLRPVTAPVARGGAVMSFDGAVGHPILFGGWAGTSGGSSGSYLGDTWEFDNGTWANLTNSTTSPAPRTGAAMAYASETAQLVLLGGYGKYDVNPPEWTWGTPQPPPPPTITQLFASPSSTEVRVSTTVHVTVVGGARPLSYSYTGLPPGCASANTSTLVCDPNASGAFRIVASVADTGLRSSQANVSLTVVPRPAIRALEILPSSVLPGENTTLTVNWTGGLPPVRFGYTGLPPGCVGPNAGSFSCQPTAAGEFSITVTVTDSRGANASATAGLIVRSASGPPPLAFQDLSLQPAAVQLGESVVVTTTTTGGLGSLTYVYEGLPSGCAGNVISAFFCTPTASGQFIVNVTVTDHTPVSVRGSALLLVVPPSSSGPGPMPPVISAFTADPTSLDVGQSVVFSVSASGGLPPYGYQYSNLPPGCASANSPSLSCDPSGAGEFVVIVTVSDTHGSYAQRITSLTVDQPFSTPPPPPAPPPAASAQLPTPAEAWLIVGAAVVVASAAAVVLVSLRPRR